MHIVNVLTFVKGYCYCVDDSGNKLEGTDTAPYLVSTLDCTSMFTLCLHV